MHRTSARGCFFGNDRSSRSRVRTRLITKTSTTSERVTHLHIPVPAITRGTLARTHELKTAIDALSVWTDSASSSIKTAINKLKASRFSSTLRHYGVCF